MIFKVFWVEGNVLLFVEIVGCVFEFILYLESVSVRKFIKMDWICFKFSYLFFGVIFYIFIYVFVVFCRILFICYDYIFWFVFNLFVFVLKNCDYLKRLYKDYC